jgi:hypothetical protein
VKGSRVFNTPSPPSYFFVASVDTSFHFRREPQCVCRLKNVNKVESGVLLRHVPTGLFARCTQERSQLMNRAIALRALKSKLLVLKLEQKVTSALRTHSVCSLSSDLNLCLHARRPRLRSFAEIWWTPHSDNKSEATSSTRTRYHTRTSTSLPARHHSCVCACVRLSKMLELGTKAPLSRTCSMEKSP